MRKSHRAALPLVALLWLASSPAPAAGGYDIAHIVERTCEPGGPLIVTDIWKTAEDRDQVITEPGEVIACPPAGANGSFQIGAGPERIGPDQYLCTYFSLLNGDGSDTCLADNLIGGDGSLVKLLMTVRLDESGGLALAGVASADVATVATDPAGPTQGEALVIPIDEQRAARLGSIRAFSYFSLPVDQDALCADEPLRVIGLDGSGQPVSESAVQPSVNLLDSSDRVTYARSLGDLCGSEAPDEAVEVGWLTEMGTVFRWLITILS